MLNNWLLCVDVIEIVGSWIKRFWLLHKNKYMREGNKLMSLILGKFVVCIFRLWPISSIDLGRIFKLC